MSDQSDNKEIEEMFENMGKPATTKHRGMYPGMTTTSTWVAPKGPCHHIAGVECDNCRITTHSPIITTPNITLPKDCFPRQYLGKPISGGLEDLLKGINVQNNEKSNIVIKIVDNGYLIEYNSRVYVALDLNGIISVLTSLEIK